MKIEIYSDVVCPWCYIGERRLNRALAAFSQGGQVEVVFRPYQLDPDAPESAVPLPEYLERRFGRRVDGVLDQVTTAARAEGIEMAWEKALSTNTRTAHRLLVFAEREYGAVLQRALAERLFERHFTLGGNIGDVDQLVEAASAAGMDAGRARAHLESGKGVQELEAELEKARRLGIQAVPTFVIDGRYAVQGAQPAAKLLEVLEEAARTSTAAPDGTAESCADGACRI